MGNISDREDSDENEIMKNKLLLNDNLYFGNEEDSARENKKKQILRKLNKKIKKSLIEIDPSDNNSNQTKKYTY